MTYDDGLVSPPREMDNLRQAVRNEQVCVVLKLNNKYVLYIIMSAPSDMWSFVYPIGEGWSKEHDAFTAGLHNLSHEMLKQQYLLHYHLSVVARLLLRFNQTGAIFRLSGAFAPWEVYE